METVKLAKLESSQDAVLSPAEPKIAANGGGWQWKMLKNLPQYKN